MAQHVSSRLDGATGIDEILDSIPADARLILRDYIKGLEAEAGTARSLATRTERMWHEDAGTLQMLASDLRRDRDALRARVNDLETNLARRATAGVLNRLRRIAR